MDVSRRVYKRSKDGFRDAFADLLRGWWIVATACLLGGVVALLVGVLTTPMFKSSAGLYVTSSAAEASSVSAYQGSLASQQRVESYVKLATSDAVLSSAIRDGGLSETVGGLKSSVSASAVPGTVMLSVSATSADSEAAAAVANAVADSMTKYVAVLEEPSGGGAPLAKLTVVTPAVEATAPFSPNVLRFTLMGLTAGLIVGLLVLVVRVRLDNVIRSEADAVDVMGVGPLGAIPEFAGDGPIDFAAGSSAEAEAFRKLRTNLAFAKVDSPAHVIVVTSPSAADGKTTTAINLAAVLGEAGSRVVLVDADLRRPTVSSRLSLSGGIGLSTCLRGEAVVGDVVQEVAGGSFSALGSGDVPPNPAELLASNRAKSVFESLRGDYDYVVVDSPPCLPVVDAAVIAELADGVLLVVRSGKTSRNDMESSVNVLEGGGGSILGCAVVGIASQFLRYQSNYYGSQADWPSVECSK